MKKFKWFLCIIYIFICIWGCLTFHLSRKVAISSKFLNQLTYVVCNILLLFLISSPSVTLVPFCFVVYYCLVCLFLWIKLYGSFSLDSRLWALLILEIMSLFSILLAHTESHQCFFPFNFLMFVLLFSPLFQIHYIVT